MVPNAVKRLLDPADLRMLDGLRLNPRGTAAGRIRGERLTRRKGISIEFADFRNYVDGDDIRHLDWNVLARLGHPVLRTYQDEEDLAVHLLVDCSPSMGFGEPTKLEAAAKLACAFGYLALSGNDAVYRWPVGLARESLPALRQKPKVLRLAEWASQLSPNGKYPLASSLRGFAGSSARAGLCVILSDGLDAGIASAVKVVAGLGHEVWFVQILSLEEIDPDIEGDLRLIDSETDAHVEITAHSETLREYKRRLASHCDSLAEACRRTGGRYVRVETTTTLQSFAKDPLKRQGWVTT